MPQYGFFFDESRCTVCHTCEVACREVRHLPEVGVKWMRVYEWETGRFPDLRVRRAALACLHCADPPCLSACPQGAIVKESRYGAVLLDSQRCGSCDRECVDACPWGSPQFAGDAAGSPMTKCDLCLGRLEQGERPVCVQACPMRALDFDDMVNLHARYGDQGSIHGVPDGVEHGPSWVVKEAQAKTARLPYPIEEALALLGVPDYPLPDDEIPLGLARSPDFAARSIAERAAATADHYT